MEETKKGFCRFNVSRHFPKIKENNKGFCCFHVSRHFQKENGRTLKKMEGDGRKWKKTTRVFVVFMFLDTFQKWRKIEENNKGFCCFHVSRHFQKENGRQWKEKEENGRKQQGYLSFSCF